MSAVNQQNSVVNEAEKAFNEVLDYIKEALDGVRPMNYLSMTNIIELVNKSHPYWKHLGGRSIKNLFDVMQIYSNVTDVPDSYEHFISTVSNTMNKILYAITNKQYVLPNDNEDIREMNDIVEIDNISINENDEIPETENDEIPEYENDTTEIINIDESSTSDHESIGVISGEARYKRKRTEKDIDSLTNKELLYVLRKVWFTKYVAINKSVVKMTMDHLMKRLQSVKPNEGVKHIRIDLALERYDKELLAKGLMKFLNKHYLKILTSEKPFHIPKLRGRGMIAALKSEKFQLFLGLRDGILRMTLYSLDSEDLYKNSGETDIESMKIIEKSDFRRFNLQDMELVKYKDSFIAKFRENRALLLRAVSAFLAKPNKCRNFN